MRETGAQKLRRQARDVERGFTDAEANETVRQYRRDLKAKRDEDGIFTALLWFFFGTQAGELWAHSTALLVINGVVLGVLLVLLIRGVRRHKRLHPPSV